MWWTNFLVPCRDCMIDCLASFTHCFKSFKSSNHRFLSPLLILLSTSRLKLRLLPANSFCQWQEPYLPLFSSFQTFSSAEQTVEWPAASSNQLANKLFVFTPYAPAYTCVPSHMIVHFRIRRWSKLDRCGRIFKGGGTFRPHTFCSGCQGVGTPWLILPLHYTNMQPTLGHTTTSCTKNQVMRILPVAVMPWASFQLNCSSSQQLQDWLVQLFVYQFLLPQC